MMDEKQLEATNRVIEVASMTREDLEKALHAAEDMADSLEAVLVKMYNKIDELEDEIRSMS